MLQWFRDEETDVFVDLAKWPSLQAAKRARPERDRLEEAGKTAPFVDGQIVAIAYTRGLTLVTPNTKDFRPFEGLTAVDWT